MDKPNPESVIVAVIAATVLFFLFSFFAVFYFLTFRRSKLNHQQQMLATRKAFEQQLRQAQIEVQEHTYRHIAQELHDNVGQLLSTTKMLMAVTELKLGGLPDTLHTAAATLAKAIDELRALSRSLDGEWLEQFDFLANLRFEMDRINASGAISASMDCPASIDMPPGEQIILFRIVQEAIQNAIRHAQPSRIRVQVTGSKALELQVVNDGKPLPEHFSGMGTNNMQKRAQLFGGQVNWKSRPEQTTVMISLPAQSTI